MKNWYPDHPAIYDIEKTYLENADEGPFFKGPIPERTKTKKKFNLFGHEVNSPIGVPAGPLLNSRWIALAAKLGYDVPTYKTIRSFAYAGHPLPNVIYVEPIDSFKAKPLKSPPRDLSQLTITNSFGMPSRSPEYLLEDIEKANRSLEPGQVMIVSIVGTPGLDVSYVDDFVQTAEFAKGAGAKIIEANFSCPNVGRAEGSLYTNPEAVLEFAKKVAKAIHPVPLILKVGLFATHEMMKRVFFAAATGGAKGICGINSVSMEVIDAPLGDARKTSGVCGGGVRRKAIEFIKCASQIIRDEKLDLTLLGCGGIMTPRHFDEMLHAGAQFALTATGMMWDPYLALRYHNIGNHGHY